MKALRFNEGKTKWSLVDFNSLKPMVDVLVFGANKYTKNFDLNFETLENICQQKSRANYVIKLKKLSQEECVNLAMIEFPEVKRNVSLVEKLEELKQKIYVIPAMKQQELKILQKLQIKSENIKNNTDKILILKKENENELLKDLKYQDTQKNNQDMNSYEDYPNMESVRIFTKQNVKEVAKYVEVKKGCTLIIVIEQDSIEEFFVVNATKELDCYKTVLTILEKLSCISKVEVNDTFVTITGKDNWKGGLDKSEILESIQRHLTALFDDEKDDPESKISHIGHIMCNCMFYSYHYVINKPTNK